MNKQSKIWYSITGGSSPIDHIAFYNPSDFQWVKTVEENFTIISAEAINFLEANEGVIKPYFNRSLVNGVTKKSSWRTSSFFLWLWTVKGNSYQCPQTMQVLRQIPGIVSASVSILETQTEIKPHRGDTDAIIRCHLPLKVPAGLPKCGFQVNEESRAWEEGKLLLFNDAARHRAWNNTSESRYVLIFDVIKSKHIRKKYWVSSRVLSGLLLQAIVQRLPFLKLLPKLILGILYFFNSLWICLLLKIRSHF